jgi:cytochrome c nitrite reductase small subunit
MGARPNIFERLKPPREWLLVVNFALAIMLGLLAFVAHASRATSYLSDDPGTCVNCHVMAPQYASWANSAHRLTATCNDCHVPHDNVVRQYTFKALDGARHATIFTLRREPQVIRIKPMGQAVVQENCLRCHADAVHTMQGVQLTAEGAFADETFRRCWDCHRETPHGRVRSLASAPYEHVPLPQPITPEWMRRREAPREAPVDGTEEEGPP